MSKYQPTRTIAARFAAQRPVPTARQYQDVHRTVHGGNGLRSPLEEEPELDDRTYRLLLIACGAAAITAVCLSLAALVSVLSRVGL